MVPTWKLFLSLAFFVTEFVLVGRNSSHVEYHLLLGLVGVVVGVLWVDKRARDQLWPPDGN